MKKILSLLTASLFVLVAAHAQEPSAPCGLTPSDRTILEQRLQANVAANGDAAERSGVVQYVPIHFHLVAGSDSTGRQKINKVLDQLCEMNNFYSPQDIRFYFTPHPIYGLFDKSINNDNVYDNQTNNFIMQNRRHNAALNVFVTNLAVSGNPPIPGAITLAYYNIPKDWIVSRKDQINGNGNGTLSHEVGHFFSLLHPFNGWDFDVFDSSYPGFPNAPSVSPLGVPTEKMDGSNCTTAGDYVCDTPPDYNFLESDCVYTGGAKDPMGVLVDPMENNIMSYFSNCVYAFTPQQGDLIHTDLNSASRNYLDNNFVPAAESITTPNDLLTIPAGGDTTDFYDQVTFEWLPVAGATYYLFEIDITSTYSTTNSQEIVLAGTSLTLTNLQSNRTYYWRVRPFNEYYTCTTAKQRTFRTSTVSVTGLNEITGLNGWNVSPNPMASGNAVRILANVENGFSANISVLDAAGRPVYRQINTAFLAGNSAIELPLGELPNGLYFVVIDNAEGRSTRKLTVIR